MKAILVPTGLTIADATRIAHTLGHDHLQFVSCRGGGRPGPRIAPVPNPDTRGARFIRDERFGTGETHGHQ